MKPYWSSLLGFATMGLRNYCMSRPYVPDEQLFAHAQESVDRVSD